MVIEGEVIVVGDVEQDTVAEPADVGYEVLCRQHHRRRMTAARAKAAALSPDVLPFELRRRITDALIDVRTELVDVSDARRAVGVLDVRWRLQGPPARADYDAGHIPGAVFVDLDRDLAA